MSIRGQQEREERAVFQEFAKVCPLPLLPQTAQSRPEPEPDILCSLRCGEMLAFELVQCEDVTNDGANADGFSSVIPRNPADAIKLKEALSGAYLNALAEGRIDDPERFKSHVVHIRFDENRFGRRNGFPGKKDRQKAAEQVIELLNKHGPGCHLINNGTVWSINCELEPNSPGEEPRFYFPTGCGARPYVVERIREKLDKGYTSEHELHLLAWSTTTSRAEADMAWRNDLVSLIKSGDGGMGPFNRIWVFGYGEKSIVFDSDNAS